MKQVSGLKEIDFIEHGFYDAYDSKNVPNPVLMNQVHSVDTLMLNERLVVAPSVDALITDKPNLILTVKTADCSPILIADKKAHLIAAIHAGWKGALQGIVENTVLQMIRMGGDPDYMVVGIGPHLQKESFEADVQMRSLFPITEHRFFTPKNDEEHFFFDFHSYIVHRLRRTGINQIDSILIDTYTDLDYNSYRRDPKNPARQYSCICIK